MKKLITTLTVLFFAANVFAEAEMTCGQHIEIAESTFNIQYGNPDEIEDDDIILFNRLGTDLMALRDDLLDGFLRVGQKYSDLINSQRHNPASLNFYFGSRLMPDFLNRMKEISGVDPQFTTFPITREGENLVSLITVHGNSDFAEAYPSLQGSDVQYTITFEKDENDSFNPIPVVELYSTKFHSEDSRRRVFSAFGDDFYRLNHPLNPHHTNPEALRNFSFIDIDEKRETRSRFVKERLPVGCIYLGGPIQDAQEFVRPATLITETAAESNHLHREASSKNGAGSSGNRINLDDGSSMNLQ
jgi:hypothetical protein